MKTILYLPGLLFERKEIKFLFWMFTVCLLISLLQGENKFQFLSARLDTTVCTKWPNGWGWNTTMVVEDTMNMEDDSIHIMDYMEPSMEMDSVLYDPIMNDDGKNYLVMVL